MLAITSTTFPKPECSIRVALYYISPPLFCLRYYTSTPRTSKYKGSTDICHGTSVTRRIGQSVRRLVRQGTELFQARQGREVARLRLSNRPPLPEPTTPVVTMGVGGRSRYVVPSG